MKRTFGILFTLFVVLAALYVRADSTAPVVFQVSSLAAFKQGEYDGGTTFAELKSHGDFGIGTVNGLDGEMIALNGQFFQIKSDGTVHAIADSEKTPYAMVTFFKVDRDLRLPPQTRGFAQLQETLDRLIREVNSILAVKISGEFAYLKVRSVPRQQKPYASLEEVLKNQTVFELRNIRGSMVGFRFPSYMDGVNSPSYHFHFITEYRKTGGHVLDCTIEGLPVEIAVKSRLELILPSVLINVTP